MSGRAIGIGLIGGGIAALVGEGRAQARGEVATCYPPAGKLFSHSPLT